LHAGFHGTIVGDGVNNRLVPAGDAGNATPTWKSDNGGGLVSFAGNRSGAANQYPVNLGAGAPNRYAAASLHYSPAANSLRDVAAQSCLPAVSYGAAVWGDYDNDGRPDLLMNGLTRDSFLASVYHNDGNGQFHDVQANLVGNYLGAAAWGDYDNDGLLDFV